jgi:hypothetical protein
LYGWHDLLVRGVVLFGDYMGRNHHGAKFSISVLVLHQLSWEFCACLYLDFDALLAEHHLLHAIVVNILNLLVGGNQSLLKFHDVLKCCDLEFCEVDITASIPSQQP